MDYSKKETSTGVEDVPLQQIANLYKIMLHPLKFHKQIVTLPINFASHIDVSPFKPVFLKNTPLPPPPPPIRGANNLKST